MAEIRENIVQEFFGKLFNTVNEFADGIFAAEIEDKQLLNSDTSQETLYKTKQSLINLTKDNIVRSATSEEFSKNTKKSFNDFSINLPNKSITLLEVCNKNESLLTKYLMIFEIPEENFKDIKDAIASAEQNNQQAEKAKSIKLEVKKEPLTEEELRQQSRTKKIMERVEKMFKRFGEAFAKIFRSEGAVLADAGIVYKGKIEIERSGQLSPTVGIIASREEREKKF